MKVLIDGKKVEVLNEIRIIEELDEDSFIALTLTHEGLIADLIETQEVTKTLSCTYDELLTKD